jgi:type II secretory ATPase GspE/PulE/Tfp pilus assembly ATPase PilB-like protein
MTLNDPRVVELVKQRGWFGGDEELALASGRAVSYVVDKDPTAFEKIGKAFAAKYNVPFIDLSKFPAATSLPSDVQKFTELINATVLKITPDTVFLATSDEDTLKSPNDTPLHVAYPTVKVGFAFDAETSTSRQASTMIQEPGSARLDPLDKPEDDAQAVIEKKQIIKAAEPVPTTEVAPVEIRAEEMVSLQADTQVSPAVNEAVNVVEAVVDLSTATGSMGPGLRRDDAQALDPPNKSEDDAQSVDAQKPSIKFVEPAATENPEAPKGPLRRLVKLLSFDEATLAPQILEEVINSALEQQASDIHLEPYAKMIKVRFRVDGVLVEAGEVPMSSYGNVLNRIKVLTHLRIDEHLSVQDGSMQFEVNDRPVDARVSIVPSIYGEKVAVRILNAYVSSTTLDSLGLSVTQRVLVENYTTRPHGLVVVTGPTGAGKTTTLYSVLESLIRPEVNVVTIEDPVEYRIPGITQIQVNEDQELTFSKGLRAIVRQDPDIILVGEIRDQDTAEIAVNASLTGHMVLTTLHANDSATAVPRLLEMGVEPFLLSSTLEIVIAQRLVRKLCDTCKTTLTKPSKKIATMISKMSRSMDQPLYQAVGCDACGGSGYKGRIAIFEILPITQKIREIILKKPSANDVWEAAKNDKSAEYPVQSLFEAGIDKALAGETSIEEVLRVAQVD